jgi:hypothetical protein
VQPTPTPSSERSPVDADLGRAAGQQFNLDALRRRDRRRSDAITFISSGVAAALLDTRDFAVAAGDRPGCWHLMRYLAGDADPGVRQAAEMWLLRAASRC